MSRNNSQVSALDLISFYDVDSLWTKSTESGRLGENGVSNLGYPTNLHTNLEKPLEPVRLSSNVYGFVYSVAPRITCDLVIDSDEGTLLTKRSERIPSWPILWHTIGAAHLQGETCAETALRAALTELGLEAHISDLRFLENVEFPLRPNDFKTKGYNNELSIFYYLEVPRITLKKLKLDKHTMSADLFKPDLSKKNYGLPAPMLPQHVYMVAKYSKHFENLRKS